MGNSKQMNRLILSAAITGILMSATAMAQDSTQAQDTQATTAPATAKKAPPRQANAKTTTTLQQVVVTGSATGVKKIDASYTLTTADAEQIKQANPKSTADLLKIAPGLWPESTGGQTGANIEIAGFPGGGDAPFNTVQ